MSQTVRSRPQSKLATSSSSIYPCADEQWALYSALRIGTARLACFHMLNVIYADDLDDEIALTPCDCNQWERRGRCSREHKRGSARQRGASVVELRDSVAGQPRAHRN